MAKNSAVNLDITNNADGYDISGGTTARKLTITGADMTLTGSGSAVHTFPSTTSTLARTDSAQTFTGTQTFSSTISGSIDGNAATVTTITGLAPDTATTQATQPNITTAAALTTVSTSLTGLLRADAGVLSIDSDVTDLVTAADLTTAGKVELATITETDTGTDATRAVTPDGLQGSKRNIRYLVFSLVASDTSVAADTTIGGDFTIPFSGTILQDDTLHDQLAATTDTAGTTGTMVVDIHLNGTTIMTTNKLDIETGEKGTQTAATQPDLTTTTVAAGDILTFDIDAVHSGTAALGLKVLMAIRED